MSDSIANVLAPPSEAVPSLMDVYTRSLQAQKGGIDVQNALAQQRWSQVLARHVDANGNPDYGAAAAEAANDPIAAKGMLSGLQSQSALQNEGLSRSHIKLGWVNGALGALPDDATPDQIHRTFMSGVASHILTPAEAQADEAEFLQKGANIPALLQQHRLTAASSMDQYNAQYGTTETATSPAGTQVYRKPPPSRGDVGPFVSAGPAPITNEWLNGFENVQDRRQTLSNGQPNPNFMTQQPVMRRELIGDPSWGGYKIGPNNELIDPSGKQVSGNVPPVVPFNGRPPNAALTNLNKPPAPPPAPSASAPQAAPPPTPAQDQTAADAAASDAARKNAPVPAPSITPAAPSAVAPTAPAVTPPQAPRLGTQSSPGETTLAGKSGDRFQSEIDNSVTAQSQRALLTNMRADSDKFTGGPGADMDKWFGQFAETWLPRASSIWTNMKPGDTAPRESFDKFAAQLATQQQGGGITDARMALNVEGIPHASQTPTGRGILLSQLQGNADYLQARAQLAQKWPAKSDYGGFQNFVRQLDPRVFQYEAMTPSQAQLWWSSLPSDVKTEIRHAHDWAAAQGVIGGNP